MPKVIRDPVHNIIEIEDDIVQLIDTYAFQRLRRIRQLGVAWLVYPAAEHSRLSHSLGVFAMCKRLISALRRNSKSFGLDKEEVKLVTVAALLHDIGHGPFSHAFENAVGKLGGSFNHEKMSIRIIQEYDKINLLIKKYGESASKQICQILRKEYPNPHVGSIISSQFDADRLDYLLRDSYMTGANYGRFDVDWLLENISVETSTFMSQKGPLVICVDHKKGLNVLEQYILGRHYMYTHVYFHKVIRAFEAMVCNIIKRVLKEEHTDLVGFKEIRALYQGKLGILDYLRLDDFVVMAWFNEWYYRTRDPILKKLLEHLFCRKPFYRTIHPTTQLSKYEEDKKEILKDFTEEEQEYYFYQDAPSNIAYKDFRISRDVLDEIFIYMGVDEVIPLSVVEDTVISGARHILSREMVRWYVKK